MVLVSVKYYNTSKIILQAKKAFIQKYAKKYTLDHVGTLTSGFVCGLEASFDRVFSVLYLGRYFV